MQEEIPKARGVGPSAPVERRAPKVSVSAPPVVRPPAADGAPGLDGLAEAVREPQWDKGSDPQLFELGSAGARLLIVDFQNTVVPADGIPISFRRFALFGADKRLIAQQTIDKSRGGLDQVEHEMRDVDGDGSPDLVFYYFREDQWTATGYGWIAATQAGQLVSAPLSLVVKDQHMFYASACWTKIENSPVQFVNWHERSLDAAGKSLSLGDRASAYAVDAHGLKAIGMFGALFAERPSLGALLAVTPKEHQLQPLDSDLVVPDCAPSGPAFLAFPVNAGHWQLVTGLAFTKERVGADWPSNTPKPPHLKVVEIPKVEPSTWLTPRAPNK